MLQQDAGRACVESDESPLCDNPGCDAQAERRCARCGYLSYAVVARDAEHLDDRGRPREAAVLLDWPETDIQSELEERGRAARPRCPRTSRPRAPVVLTIPGGY